jgi:iron complex outermembrane recepter protein
MRFKKTILVEIILFISSLSFANYHLPPGKTSLSGRITDKHTGDPMPGVSVYIPDLKTGTISDVDGYYKIDNLPQSSVLIQVTFIGYKLIAKSLDLTTTTTADFSMEESVNELNEVVITGLSRSAEKNRTPTPISTIPPTVLLQNSSTNIIDALAKQPGISQVTTGAGISKPVIRGLGYNRVVTVNDGIRQEGQQWGDEHGIEIDEYTIQKVEILKGPASLTYGSDAMAGVINLFSAPTLPEGTVKGNILANYQTNNGLYAFSANLAGNEKGFIWDLRYSDKMAHSYQNHYDGYVLNSGFKENTVSGIIGFNKSWGYSHLHFSSYHLTPGIVEGERDSATGQFIKPIAVNDTLEGYAIGSDDDFKSYTPLTPYQRVGHYKAVLNNSFVIGDGSLKATIGWQQNQRKEFADILEEGQYGLYFLLNTINYDLRYLFPEKNNLDLSIGVNGMQQTSRNKGSEFLIPEYDLFDFGVFALAKKNLDKLDVSGGVRYDSRNEKGKDLFLNTDGEPTSPLDPEAFHQFSAFNSNYIGVSGSLGASYQFSESVFTKLNVSRGFRAPNIAEISANGVHEGTINYIIGVPNLKPENSLQFDYALGLNSEHVTAEMDVFSNSIKNYIFLHKLESVFGGDSITDGFQTFTYASGDASLLGGEISIDIHPHPLDWLHFENSFSYVLSTQQDQPDSTKYLPFTPAPKWISEIRATAKKIGNSLANAYFNIGLEDYFKQDKFYSAFGTETATPGYLLLNLGIGTDIVKKGSTLCSIYINGNNLTDVAYQSHLSRLKYGPVNNVTGRTGVYNMGRNFSFKVLIPIGFAK